jgi:hypothetical protein
MISSVLFWEGFKPSLSQKEKRYKTMKKLLDFIVFLFTGKCDDAVDAGICDYGGQGRDKCGK